MANIFIDRVNNLGGGVKEVILERFVGLGEARNLGVATLEEFKVDELLEALGIEG